MRFDILTLFPDAVDHYLNTSIIGRARSAGLIRAHIWNIRDFAEDKHHTVDDTPYGGGAGMVMKIAPINKALEEINSQFPVSSFQKRKTVVLSARGRQFTQAIATACTKLDQLILICGRYEGIDQRVADNLAQEELSIGPFVLAGGELAALAVTEAVSRLLPGVLGNPASLTEESFSTTYNLSPTTSVEYPQYTKPADYEGWKVPEVLLSGDHEAIRQWRKQQRKLQK